MNLILEKAIIYYEKLWSNYLSYLIAANSTLIPGEENVKSYTLKFGVRVFGKNNVSEW
jgi:hypothetical protein